METISPHVSFTARRWNDKDEIVATDVADESLLRTHTFYHIVQDLRENADHTIAVVITISIVEFLEVIQVRVADSERCVLMQSPRDFGLDVDRARKSRGWMDEYIAIGTAQQDVNRIVTRRRQSVVRHLVGARVEGGASAPSAVAQKKSAGMIPVNESLFSRVQASRQPSAWERPSKTTSLGRPLSARAMSSSALCTSTAGIPRAASHEEIASGGGPPPGLNTIAVCRCDTLRDAHAGGREVIGGIETKSERERSVRCVTGRRLARASRDHL